MAGVTDGQPRVSVLLPTYNRARFLPAALAAIAGQSFTDWELVVLDDGSTDDTAAVVGQLTAGWAQPVRYVHQANAGAYAARNAALDLAAGALVAFYDSDDIWLPHHLRDSVAALESAPDVDWVYAACRTIDHTGRHVIDPDTFRENGEPRPFRRLAVRRVGALHVIDDPRVVECQLLDGLYCGLQNSVIRRSVFDAARFHAAYRNEAEDQLFVIRALKRGHRIGYLDAVHVEYHVHGANSSASATGQSVERELSVYRPVARGFEDLLGEFAWSGRERRALRRRIHREHFWHIGYALLWMNGRRAEALASFRAGLEAWPWSPGSWKAYALARLRAAVGPGDGPNRGVRP
jgi:glycosyltransferase involved in cell wall biosynthesis